MHALHESEIQSIAIVASHMREIIMVETSAQPIPEKFKKSLSMANKDKL
jgi:hypothetical protein